MPKQFYYFTDFIKKIADFSRINSIQLQQKVKTKKIDTLIKDKFKFFVGATFY